MPLPSGRTPTGASWYMVANNARCSYEVHIHHQDNVKEKYQFDTLESASKWANDLTHGRVESYHGEQVAADLMRFALLEINDK
jgi:hypothetical protein